MKKTGMVLLFILGSLLPCFSFPPFKLWQIAWFGFVVVLFLINKVNPLKSFLQGLLAGFVFYSFLLNWIYSVAGPFYLFVALYLAIYWAVFFSIIFSLPEKNRVIIAGCLWYFLEIINQHLLTGFPWIFIGLSQWSNPATARISSITGSAGLSSIIIAVNFAVYEALRYKKFLSVFFTAVILFFLSWLSVILTAYHSPDFNFKTIAAVQANCGYFGQDPEQSFEKYSLITEKIPLTCDLIVWPESSYPAILEENKKAMEYLIKKSFHTPVLVGSISKENGNIYNSAYFFNNGNYYKYDKRHLVPFGEFVPGKRFKIVREIYKKFAGGIPEMKKGQHYQLFQLDSSKFLVLICYENIFPEMTVTSEKEPFDFIIVITNDSWYGNSFGPYQHFAHNIFRSFETGTPVVQVSTTGITGSVYPNGQVTMMQKEKKHLFVEGTMLVAIPDYDKMKTIYEMAGETFVAMIFLLLTGVYLCRN